MAGVALPHSNCRRGLITIQLRHLAIHENDVVRQSLDRLDRVFTVGGNVDPAPTPIEYARCDFLVDRVVLRDKDSQFGAPFGRRPLSRTQLPVFG